jgi:large-conductance mechanosensitive channel
MDAASGLLSKPAYFLHWGVVQISLANFLVIIAMIVVFVLALVIPFPHGRRDAEERTDDDERG